MDDRRARKLVAAERARIEAALRVNSPRDLATVEVKILR
jgi:hypothetical protein